ncbi:MAG: acyl carrier protein [Ureaplasma sp.]|nr:acyl carrier protein [Ureaplasma sp.]
MSQDIKKILNEIAQENKIKINLDNLDANLKDLGIDSLKTMDLIFKVENKLNIMIPDEELIKIKNLRDLINILETLVK